MSVISTKNPVLIEVDKDFRRYTSNPKMRARERHRMLYNLAHRIEMGEVMEMLKEAKEAKEEAEESVAKSKAEGKAEGIAAKIASLLARRFGVVPSQLTDSLHKIGNLDKLDELFDFALDCQTLKEFKTRLR